MAMFNGKQRKLALTASRNGYFFVVDRVTGEHLITSKYGKDTNWSTGLNKFGGPARDPAKDPTSAGSIVSPTAGGTINWQPPAYSPEAGSVLYGGGQRVFDFLPDGSWIRAARWGWAGKRKSRLVPAAAF